MRECKSECLAWNTMILMAGGSEKRISEICIGESVMLNTGKKLGLTIFIRDEKIQYSI